MRSKQKVMHIFITYVLCFSLLSGAQNIAQINELSARLLKNYNKDTLPVIDHSKSLKVGVKIHLLALGDLDEVDEKLSTVLGLELFWNDENMVWNTGKNHGITNLTMNQDSLWKPSLVIYNPHHSRTTQARHKDLEKILVDNDGNAVWSKVTTLDTTCDLDTKYFPFDIQSCEIWMSLPGYNVKLVPSLANDTRSYEANGAWSITKGEVRAEYKTNSIFITYEMTRKPLFMLINLLLPIFVLALLSPLVFILPNGTGERAGYAIKTLLAISVYMTIISGNLPKNSCPLPLVTVMLFVWYMLNSSIVVIVIINTKLFNLPDDKPVPRAARAFVKLVRCCCINKKDKKNADGRVAGDEERKSCLEDEEDKKIENNDEAVKPKHGAFITWSNVSVAIDRVAFVFSYLIKLGFVLVMIFLMKFQPKF